MRRRRRKTLSVGEIGSDIARRLDPKGTRHRGAVVRAWSVVAGPDVLGHTRGYAFREGELLVYVDSPVWANELSAMSETYRGRLNQEVGQDVVRSIRFTVSKRATEDRADPEEPEREQASRRSRPREELSASEVAQVEHAASGIADEGLREVATRITLREMERLKGESGDHGTKHATGAEEGTKE